MPDQDAILADPAAHTVEDVTAAMKTATRAQVQEAKAREAAGKNRVGILEFEPPRPARPEPTFSRARILDPKEGPVIVGHIDALGRTARIPDIAGALDADDRAEFTRDEIRGLVESFLSRPVEA